MFFKPRCEPQELKIMRHLHIRMNLKEKEAKNYLTMEKGFEGEKKFDEMSERISKDCTILNDLLLENSNSVFQIDSLFIYDGTIHIINIKNFEGDYLIDGEKWYRIATKKEISNPFLQLDRSESLMRRLLKELGYNMPLKTHIVFINPDFILYQAPLNLPIVFFPQIKSFLDQFITRNAKPHDKHLVLAEKIASLHIKNSPYMNLPEYTYEQLVKGITCPMCFIFISDVKKDAITCKGCGFQENIETAILRCVEEYRLLFPERKITTEDVWEWCKVINSRKTIRRILKGNFKLIGYGKSSHYIDY